MTGSPASFRPFMQGQLDGLCGVYAIINAVRLVLGPKVHQFAEDDWRELFFTLLLATDEAVGAVNATACGIEAKPLRKMFAVASRFMVHEHGVKVIFSPLVGRSEGLFMQEVLERVAAVTQDPCSTVIASLENRLDHWTVIRKVTDRWLTFFDSAGFTRVSRAKCRLSDERPRDVHGAEHVFDRHGLFRVALIPTA